MYIKFLIILAIAKQVLGANILALMVVVSHSHHFWNVKYLKALAERGHQITYLTVDLYENPPKNIRPIYIEGVYDVLFGQIEFTDITKGGPYFNEYMLNVWENSESEYMLKTNGLKRLKEIIRKEKFDLVIHDIGSSPFLLGAVDVLGRPPVVGITAYGVPLHSLQVLGNPINYASRPHFYSPYSNEMNFFQRINNYFLHLFSFVVGWFFKRKQNEYSIECFGKNIRPLDEILDDINIIMVNENFGIDYVFPKVPGLVAVGGLHIEKPKPLPQDLQKFLDEAHEGVVYFSLGSNIQSSELGEKKTKVLMDAFRLLVPVKVLWKFEAAPPANLPSNVYVHKWMPQNDILAHPNVRFFFTHCGALSTQEAIYHGKPIVGMPFFLDQHVNIQKCLNKGFAEKLDFASLTTEKIVQAIKVVLDNPKYAESAKNASKVFRDHIVSPLETAVYWTEYAIKHNGARHLRHSARDLSWYQNNLLDLYFFFFFCLYVSWFTVKKICKKFCSNENMKKNMKVKKN